MATKSVFYAWQSQRPSKCKCNRSLIEEALNRTLKELTSESGGQNDYKLDQDTRGTVGAREISSTILTKIDDCSVFVADVTPVGKLIDEKPTPNPNVLFELGFAWHKLGENRIILVLNRKYGVPEDLPFDISKRCLVQYYFDPNASDGPAETRAALTVRLKDLLSKMFHAAGLGPLLDIGLNQDDIKLFETVYARVIEEDIGCCGNDRIIQLGQEVGLDMATIVDAAQVITDKALWKSESTGGGVPDITPNMQGMEQYCETFLDGYASLRNQVAKMIVEGEESSRAVAGLAAYFRPPALECFFRRSSTASVIRELTDRPVSTPRCFSCLSRSSSILTPVCFRMIFLSDMPHCTLLLLPCQRNNLT